MFTGEPRHEAGRAFQHGVAGESNPDRSAGSGGFVSRARTLAYWAGAPPHLAAARSPPPHVEARRSRSSRAPQLARILSLLLLPAAASGCAFLDQAVVGVENVGTEHVDEELDQNALSSTKPSASTLEALHYFGLTERWQSAPDQVLLEMHRAVLADRERRFLHALAELSYLRARDLDSRDHYLAAAVYAWFYLLGEDDIAPPNPYERRFRWACDLYNRGLREAFFASKEKGMELSGGTRTLPAGSIAVSVDRSMFPHDDASIAFMPADEYSVWGLSVRLRDSGLGTPLVGTRPTPAKLDPATRMSHPAKYAPATMFLRVHGKMGDLEHGIAATLELHSFFGSSEVEVDGKHVPLESDFTTALAVGLHGSKIWGFTTRGFFGGDDTTADNGLKSVRPAERGLVPVVFVHGTASNPGYWAEMFNLLLAEPAIRKRMQFWFFQYSSGSPISFSAAVLREQLRDTIAKLDPEGTDPALRHMVVIGHSQGGLLAKLMAVDSDMGWWNDVVGTPIEEFHFPAEQEKVVRDALDFDPVQQVDRVVFISTPHGGSFLSDRWFSRMIAKMIAMPGELSGLNESLGRNVDKLPKGIRPTIPTSLDNMTASNPFLQMLRRAPLAPGVEAHSIISIGDCDTAHPEGSDDGIVEYESAHIPGVESEFLVPIGHSCQADPRTIAEVRRILLLHLARLPEPAKEPVGQ